MSAELFELIKAQQAVYKAAHNAGLDSGKSLRSELLAALKALRRDHSRIEPHHEDLCALCKQADAAIGKAEAQELAT